ncbi:MAG: N-acetylneuraminate synthase family protein [Planctomycetes bacterium]|nr:N-acetylneuraminate synthase family protein [Planctomycetota bacterium]
MDTVKLGERLVGEGEPVFVIAEAGINHNGERKAARDLVVAAAEAGADCVKFQTHLPDHEMLRGGETAAYVGESLYDLLTRCALTVDDHRDLQRLAWERGVLFLSTPFSREAADLLETLDVAAYKTGSGELTNLPLQRHIARKGRPMIISTGMSTLEEVGETLDAVRRLNPHVVLAHCTSTYPTPYEDVNLGVIPVLRERFRVPVGLSDHSRGTYTALGAVALGACLIEKHFTLDRRGPGPDQAGSIEPGELAELVRGVRAVRAASGRAKEVLPGEAPVRRMAAESVVTLRAIRAGCPIRPEDVWVKRPGTGIPARRLEEVVGRVARKDLQPDVLVAWEDLA